MTLTIANAVFHFPTDFDARSEFEMESKGYLCGGSVELPDGRQFAVTFYDPVRLAQDVEASGAYGVPLVAEPGLVVIPEVTRPAIERSIPALVAQKFFEHLRPMITPTANGVSH